MRDEEEKEINLLIVRRTFRTVIRGTVVVFLVYYFWEDILEWISNLPNILKGW